MVWYGMVPVMTYVLATVTQTLQKKAFYIGLHICNNHSVHFSERLLSDSISVYRWNNKKYSRSTYM
jgi:hypothetical protein